MVNYAAHVYIEINDDFFLLSQTKHPFILRPRFLQFIELWFKKSGLRNLVQEKWFCKLRFFFWFEKTQVVDQKNRWVYTINPPFFRLERSGSANSDFFFWFEKSEFAEPLFQNHISTLFQKSGCRLNGPKDLTNTPHHFYLKII